MDIAASAFAPTAFSDSHIPLTVARLNSDTPSKDSIVSALAVMPQSLSRRPTDLPIDHRLVYRQRHGMPRVNLLAVGELTPRIPFGCLSVAPQPAAVLCGGVPCLSRCPLGVASTHSRGHAHGSSRILFIGSPIISWFILPPVEVSPSGRGYGSPNVHLHLDYHPQNGDPIQQHEHSIRHTMPPFF